uniref:DUF3347 domain-containing protein n=4 Tax=unclassified Prevotella TaxID=2638335 RepID=A0AB33JFE2_9BACT
MKKIVLTIVAMLSMTMAFAEGENTNATNVVAAYDMNVNFNKLADALSLSVDQIDGVKDIHKTFAVEMLNAANAPVSERKSMKDKAIAKDLKYMHYVLDNGQYRKYLMLLNATLNNRGIND